MEKINSKSFVRSKFFWGSVIVILLATSITFYILEEKEKALRLDTEANLAVTLAEKKIVERDLAETIRAKNVVEEELATEKERSSALEEDVKEKERQIVLTLDKLEKEIAARRQAEARLIIFMEAKRILETKLKRPDETPKTIKLEGIVVKAAPVVAGKVLAVNEEHGFIIVDLGRVNNLKLGDILSVYRNEEFVGRVKVERVEEGICAAAILSEWQDVEFKENDEVRGI